MKFAHFAHVWHKDGLTPGQRYQQLWRELQACDELGFDYGFVVEHHFRPDESLMSAPNLYAVAAGARTKRIRLGGMGHVVPLHHPVRLVEEIALADQMLQGRLEVGLVPGITEVYFGPFGADFKMRREVTLDFVGFLKAAYTQPHPFSYHGKHHAFDNVSLAVRPAQAPFPPLWIETRDPATLAFCAREGINVGYFILFPRADAHPRYTKFLADWAAAGHARKPNIAYSTVVYVDETDDKALKTALHDAGRAYAGFFGPLKNPGDRAEEKAEQEKRAKFFEERGEANGAEIMRNLLDPDYLQANDLILVGSPETVTRKLKAYAEEGLFNTFFGEFNFGNLAEADLMRSIRLFGTEVMPKLRSYEPF
jgi:alkanesulfonate monooxygenase SsuD/methylene tetrahydromethanopterin reductase-like flavin-dependent oxidoreductase (luciferase family)